MKFKVNHQIFERFPGVRIGVLFLKGIDNAKNKDKIHSLLKEEEKKQNSLLQNIDFAALPETAGWRSVYEAFGSKPRDYRSSIEALLRRVKTGNPLPTINPLVDLYNYLSIHYYLPAGAEDLDKVIGDIELTFAQGDEKGKYIGSTEEDTCYPGEVIYKDQKGFICRRWNWREGDRTKIEENTRNAVLVIEALPEISEGKFEAALKETADLVKQFLGGEITQKVLTAGGSVFENNFQTGSEAGDEEEIDRPTSNSSQKTIKIKNPEPPKSINKIGFAYQLAESLIKVLEKLGIPISTNEISLEHPAIFEHGDYSTNIALKLLSSSRARRETTSRGIPFLTREKGIPPCVPPKAGLSRNDNDLLSKNPHELAEEILKTWQEIGLPDFVEKVEVAGPGFLNIWLNFEALSTKLTEVLDKGDRYGSSNILASKKILLEHTSPNTNKSLHVGHVRNNILGMSLARLLAAQGAKVNLDCLYNDRGIHVCKAMWAYLKKDRPEPWREVLDYWFGHQDEWPSPQKENKKSDHFVEEFYGLGVRSEDNEVNKQEMGEILVAWEKKDPPVRALWQRLNDWVYEGFAVTLQRLGSHHDFDWYESQFYEPAKEMVARGLEKNVLKKLPDGAVLTNLESFGLADTIVQRADGTSMYFTQDIYLTKQKTEKFLADQYIWVVGPEQQLHLKQVFAVAEQMGIGEKEKFLHLWYGYVFLKGKGKMSSRAGTVVAADDLMAEAHDYARKLINEESGMTAKEKEAIAEAVGVGAIKYALLKLERTQDVNFDWQETISLKGNSGPYIQYTYARAQSVLRKTKFVAPDSTIVVPHATICGEEMEILRTFYRFPEVVTEAAKNFSPNLICNFLFDLSQKFNLFYDKKRIIGSENESFRLCLTSAVGQILKNGLRLLGIEALERM